ncbi:MAG: sulfite exporter TauE/SafE family protein [Beijerinckiaceae bacterium]
MLIYLPIAEMPVSVFLVLGMSAAVGFISGLFGVGGGFLMTPLLVFLGIPAPVAVASGAAQIAASSTTGVLNHWRKKTLDAKLGSVLVAGGLIGTILGVWFFNAMRRAGYFEVVLVISYVLLLGAVGGLMLFESLKAILAPKQVRTPRPARADGRWWFEALPLVIRFERSQVAISAIPLVGLGIFIGFAGALLGIGGGFIVVPALIYLFRIPTAVVVGTSLFQILFTMAVATLLHAVTNQSVDIALAMILIVGSVIGAQFGARAGQNLRGEHFRLFLAILVFGVAVRFAIDIIVRPTELYSISRPEQLP